MEVANQGKSVGILSAAPKSAGLQLGGSGNPDFLIAADTTNNKLESMVQIHGSTSKTGQGELTISTQGTDSSGNVARGKFNLIADDVRINSQPFLPKAWVLYENPASTMPTYTGNAGQWYNNSGLFAHIEGPDYSDYWKYDKTSGIIYPLRHGYWYIVNVMMGYGSGRNMAGIFDESDVEIVSSGTAAYSGIGTTARVDYLIDFTDAYTIGKKGLKLKVLHGGTIYISRRVTYANIIYLGP